VKKRTILTCAVGCMLIAVFAMAEFTAPDTATLRTLIDAPEGIDAIVSAANEDQAAMVIIQVISIMQAEKMDPADIQQAVAVMFQKTAEVRGAQFGSAVVSLVRKKVNPRLLPVIRTGGGSPPPPPPPGPSPRYPNQ
jgi:hypothetical protein